MAVSSSSVWVNGTGPSCSTSRQGRISAPVIVRLSDSPAASPLVMTRSTTASAAAAIGRDALVGNPHALRRRAPLPEHVDRNPAAWIPVAADPEPGGLDQLDNALGDADGRILMEGAGVAEAREIKLERLRFEQPRPRRVIDDEMREV